jgi:hypothetical protein
MRLGDKLEHRAVTVEAPRPPGLDEAQARLVVAIKDLLGDAARGVAVGQRERIGAVPLHANNRHRDIGNQAAEGRSRRERIKVHGEKLVVLCRPCN